MRRFGFILVCFGLVAGLSLGAEGKTSAYIGLNVGYSSKWNLVYLSAEQELDPLFAVSLDILTNPLAAIFLNNSSKASEGTGDQDEYSEWVGRMMGIGSSQYLKFGPVAIFNRLWITDWLFTLNLGARVDIEKTVSIQLTVPYVAWDLYSGSGSGHAWDRFYHEILPFRINLTVAAITAL